MNPQIQGVINAVSKFRQAMAQTPEAQKKRTDFYENKVRQPVLQGIQNLPFEQTPIGKLGRPITSAIANQVLPETRPMDAQRQKEFGFDAAMDMTPGMAAATKATKAVKAVKGFADNAVQVFKGFDDLSLQSLEQLKGSRKVSKQHFINLTNQGNIKQAERDAIRSALEDYGDDIPVKEFAEKVKTDLLPLEVRGTRDVPGTIPGKPMYRDMYESTTLPPELRGNVADYKVNIYESPITNSAGDVHFREVGTPNYFAHTRVEDLPGKARVDMNVDGFDPNTNLFTDAQGKVLNPGDTRRVIEIQSDLFQKGRLNEIFEPDDGKTAMQSLQGLPDSAIKSAEADAKAFDTLAPYRNTWHERIIKEEVKQAAIDGKNKLQFPTGETAMKIEGLGDNTIWEMRVGTRNGTPIYGRPTPSELEVGKTLVQNDSNEWIITDVLGDGKFKAVTKDVYDLIYEGGKKEIPNSVQETFDISGKVDTDNPIYRFYEKDIQKFLNRKYNAKRITDPQGIEWFEITVKPEQAKLPIEAFGILPFLGAGALMSQRDNRQN